MIQLYDNVSCLHKDLWDFAEEGSFLPPPAPFLYRNTSYSNQRLGRCLPLQ